MLSSPESILDSLTSYFSSNIHSKRHGHISKSWIARLHRSINCTQTRPSTTWIAWAWILFAYWPISHTALEFGCWARSAACRNLYWSSWLYLWGCRCPCRDRQVLRIWLWVTSWCFGYPWLNSQPRIWVFGLGSWFGRDRFFYLRNLECVTRLTLLIFLFLHLIMKLILGIFVLWVMISIIFCLLFHIL